MHISDVERTEIGFERILERFELDFHEFQFIFELHRQAFRLLGHDQTHENSGGHVK